MKKMMVWILAVLMMLSVFGGTALAEENGEDPGYQFTNPYVINLGGKANLGDYDAWESSLYASPYVGKMSYPRVDLTPDDYESNTLTYSTVQELYNLININVLNSVADGQRAGKGAYASIPAYCTDASVGAHAGYEYQRKNLEESTYYPEGVAGRIRAIMWNSFPHVRDMSAIAGAVNAWLDATVADHVDVVDLTEEEALQATQLAIWDLAGGNQVTVHAPITTRSGSYTWRYTADELAGWVHYTAETDLVYPYAVEGEHTVNNINMLFNYLMALEPMAPQTIVVSEIAFADKGMAVVPNTDGTYDVAVNAVVNVVMGESDTLTLTASMGGMMKNVSLHNGENHFQHIFKNVAAVEAVKLEINGYQTGRDAYFFTGAERVTTQSMVAFDESSLPVHAETMIDPVECRDNAISITKVTTTTEQDPEGQDVTVEHPLYGIEFDVFYVCDMNTYNANLVEGVLNADILAAKQWVSTMTTGTDGKAFCDVTLACKNNGIADANGVYQLVEKAHPAIQAPADPVLVFLPYTTEVDGNQTTVYTAEVKLNNTVKPAPEVSKDVQQINNDRLSVNADAAHTWIIRGEVPADMAKAVKYEITDVLDYRLSYIPGSVVVKAGVAGGAAGSESLTLSEGTHYTMNAEVFTNEQGHGIDRLTVSLTEAGMEAVGALLNDGQAYEVRVYFDAKIDANGAINTEIPNQAALTYTNSAHFAHDTKYSDIPVVYTHGLRIYKYDAANAGLGLEGALFKVARIATDAEVKAGISQSLVMDSGETVQVYYESFYTVPDWTAENAEKVNYVTTGEGGLAMIYGLAEGTYYLVEVRAPQGYNLMSHPKEASIHSTSDQEIGGVGVPNTSAIVLPPTGGIGTLIFTVGGGLLIAVAIVILLKKKKDEDEDEDEE